VPRDEDATVPVAPPAPRPGLEAEIGPSEIVARVNLPSPERAAGLRALRREGAAERPLGEGPPPLVERRPPIAPNRPLSYTAISAHEENPEDYRMKRVTDLEPAREERMAHGAAVHALLEWSQENDWAEPSVEVATRHAVANGLPEETGREMLEPVRQWLDSPLRRRIAEESDRARAEVPLLLGLSGTVLRGSIDLLAEREGTSPLIVDYKTDRLGSTTPAAHAERYEVQRSIYALAVAEALGAKEVEVAYVFLERPDEPAISVLGPSELATARSKLEAAIAQIGSGPEVS
jgi:hypothetical protein